MPKPKAKSKPKSRTSKKGANKKAFIPKWALIFILIVFTCLGVFLIYTSFATAKPNLRFQILKNEVCTNFVGASDSNVHIRIYRTTGSETISNITVKVDGNAVATNPSSINGPVTNLMIASPRLGISPSNHTITVFGNKGGQSVEFSPYCEASASTNRTVTVTPNTPAPAVSNGNQNQNTITESTSGNARYLSFPQPKRYRVWEQANMYNLDTLRVTRVLNPRDILEDVTRLAYLNGAFFISQNPARTNGINTGVFTNKVYEINAAGNPANGLPMRNYMPLSNHRTIGGECTSQRVWHEGLNNNLVAAIQRIELHLGREVPLATAYRTYEEQSCLYNRYAGTSQPVAAPGQSNHNRGLAVDVDRTWLNSSNYREIFRQYSLCETVSNDPGHFELCGSKR